MEREITITFTAKIDTTSEPDGEYDVAWVKFDGDCPTPLATAIEDAWAGYAPEWAERQKVNADRDRDDREYHARKDDEA